MMTGKISKSAAVAALVVAMAAPVGASSSAAPQSLEPVFSSSLAVNGATTTREGRLFVPVQPSRSGAPQLMEIRDGKPVAYPDNRWNGWKPGMDGHDRFVGVNAIRVGPDGALWVVDRGSPGVGKPPVPGGFKLVKIDLSRDRVERVYDLDSVSRPWSFIDDVRFRGDHAYLTDAGAPGLIVLDVGTGKGRRVLEGHPSTVAQSPLKAEGKPLTTEKGDPVNIHADQLEVSPDGKWLYYQPCSGRLSRIETKHLDDPRLGDAELARHVERFADTPSTGGTAIGKDGTIYLSDVDKKRILTISPQGHVKTLFSDSRLIWVDAMWIDDKGDLLLPAAQLNRTPGLNGGKNTVQQPITLYRYPIGQKGARG
ncbi:L-dopachrome tautomerase-related protein [Streptomyces sp. NPDC086091]|uniref:L-dopachrome tautomerase-related protein n=1 Tax=Streptomyces sp. NPDC086091 TaxID=3365751 RepID=UPI003811B01A